MEVQTKSEFVLIPSPGRGHLSVALEMANTLVHRDHRLSVTVLVIKSPSNNQTNTHFPESNSRNIRFVDITQPISTSASAAQGISHIVNLIDTHKDRVRNEVAKIGSERKLVGLIIDIFCTGMISVANELSVPAYLFFTSGAAMLGFMLHTQALIDYENLDLDAWASSADRVSIPSYEVPIPVKVLPSFLMEQSSREMSVNLARNLRKAKGIIVNTFREIETHALRFLAEDAKTPPVYTSGPILHVDSEDVKKPKYGEIIQWLDKQPDSSVVFLCFGSMGCFNEVQVKEIAVGLEKSGHRFLWSLRKPPGENTHDGPSEYEDPSEVLPEGFVQRTANVGKVIGWAPQVAVLSHRAVGGFVSHCGWNSTLESVWCGVPMAAWPLYAEQSMNGFQLVKELGVGVEINLEYQKTKEGGNMLVGAAVIESGIKRLMDPGSDVRVRMEALKVESRKAVAENGSSFESVGRFIDDAIGNMG